MRARRTGKATRTGGQPLDRATRSTKRTSGLLVILVGMLVLAWGCRVSKEDVKGWAGSKDGYRLRKVVADAKQSLAVRKEAALALVNLGRCYELEKSLFTSSRADRRKIAAWLVTKLMPGLKSRDSTEVARAKDGLFSAWYFVVPALRRPIEKALVQWVISGDKEHAGDHSIDKILKSFGVRGAVLLADLMPPAHPKLFRWDNRHRSLDKSSLVGRVYLAAPVDARLRTATRFMKIADKSAKLSLINECSLLRAIAALGGASGVTYLTNLMTSHRNPLMRVCAASGLWITGLLKRELMTPAVRQGALKELQRMMGRVLAGKDPQDTGVGETLYSVNLLELVALFKDPAVYQGLSALVAASPTKLEDSELQSKKMFLRLMAVAYLMRVNPEKGLKVGYDKLPTEESYARGYLLQTIHDSTIYLWQKRPETRKKLLKALRAGLSHPSWVAKILAVEGLALKELLPRPGLHRDIRALRRLQADETELKGDDWQGATLGKRAKIALEVLAKKK